MMQRRDIEGKLALYDELSDILGAMKSFALVELRRLSKNEQAQHHAVEILKAAFGDMASVLPEAPESAGDIYLLFGSARGFCGRFNEDVYEAWQNIGGMQAPTIAIGERLSLLLPESAISIPGASGAQDASDIMTPLLEAMTTLRAGQSEEMGLVALVRDEHSVVTHQLLPLPAPDKTNASTLPLTNEAPAKVAEGVAEHYLFHSLFALLLRSLYIENHMRLLQMENALSHLGRKSEEMQLMRNRLRQEEIVEEIELIAGGGVAF